MRCQILTIALAVSAMAGCASQSSIKPVEYLDDRTAMTVGSLKEPIEFVPSVRQTGFKALGSITKRVSFAYLGPVEWDRSGSIVYGLWVHVAPGSDKSIADIRSPDALTLTLDSGTRVLTPIDAPQLGRGAYQPVASWGQTAYFELTVEMLKQMAASQTMTLNVKAQDGNVLTFEPSSDTHSTLGAYLQARGLTAD